jgi:DNA-binding Lrp family transcriptional regulator
MDMTSAYIFINCAGKTPFETVTAVRKIEGVKQAHVVAGPDDVIAFVEAENMEELEKIIVNIRKIAVTVKSDTRVTWSV